MKWWLCRSSVLTVKFLICILKQGRSPLEPPIHKKGNCLPSMPINPVKLLPYTRLLECLKVLEEPTIFHQNVQVRERFAKDSWHCCSCFRFLKVLPSLGFVALRALDCCPGLGFGVLVSFTYLKLQPYHQIVPKRGLWIIWIV